MTESTLIIEIEGETRIVADEVTDQARVLAGEAATLAGLYANADAFADIPGGVPGWFSGRHWADRTRDMANAETDADVPGFPAGSRSAKFHSNQAEIRGAAQVALAAGQAAIATGAAVTAQALLPDAVTGRRLADTAASGFESIFQMASAGTIGAEAATGGRLYKAFDAGAANGPDTIRTGTVVDAITLHANVARGTGRKYRVRIWQRPLTVNTPSPGTANPQLNVDPGASGDTMLSDTGLLDFPAGKIDNDGAGTRMGIDTWPLLAPFIVASGFRYLFELFLEDGAGVLVSARFGRLTTTAGAQALAGRVYATTGATSYTNLVTTRRYAFGFSRRRLLSVETVNRAATGLVPAVPVTTALSEMERKMLVDRGAWSTVKRPLTHTKLNGLARLNVATGVYGVDFGPRVLESQMTDLATDPNWNGTAVFLQQTNVNSPEGHLFERVKGLVITQSSNTRVPVVLRDFILQGHPNGTTPFTRIFGYSQEEGTDTFGSALLEYGLLENYLTSGAKIRRGTIRNVLIRNTGQNGFNCGNREANDRIFVEGVLIHRAGALEADQFDPHGDGIECNASRRMSVTASTIYCPNTTSVYNDNQGGQAACIIQGVAANNSLLENSFVLGNLLVGCNPTNLVWLGSSPGRTGGIIRNFVRAFNIYGIDGYTSPIAQGVMLRRPLAGGSGTWNNIAMFDEYDVEGNPMPFVGDALPASYATRIATPDAHRANEQMWGVFDYNKAVASADFIEMLHLIGRATGRVILDSNNDLNPAFNLGNLNPLGA